MHGGAVEAKELEELEQLPPAVAPVAGPAKSEAQPLETETPPPRPWTPSYSVTSQGPGKSKDDAPETDVTEPEEAKTSAAPATTETPANFPTTQAGGEKYVITLKVSTCR
jgi:hypothetical protein